LHLYCGIDWATAHHDVAVVDDTGRVVARGRVRGDAAGFARRLGLLAEIGDDRARFADTRGLNVFGGSATITRASGKKSIVLHQHIKNRRVAAVGSAWTLASLRASPGARRHFDARRTAGDWNHQAQRHVFNKFLGQLHHCLHTGRLYDEHLAFPPPLPLAADS
jgi:hypothetical protein